MAKPRTLANTVANGNLLSDGSIGVSEVTGLQNALDAKLDDTDIGSSVQATLVSGTNIKTLNGNSLLGSGNIILQSDVIGDIKQTITTTPSGWLPCDGSEYAVSSYPSLAAIIPPNTNFLVDNGPASALLFSGQTIVHNGSNTFVMLTGAGNFSLARSSDGVNWVDCLYPISQLKSLRYVNGYFIAGSTNGFYYSTDAITWSFKYLSISNYWVKDACYIGSNFVLVLSTGANVLYSTSLNGSWASVNVGNLASQNINQLVVSNGIAYILSNPATGSYFTSTDGATWTQQGSITNHRLFDIAYSGGRWIIVGDNGSGTGVMWTSTNGTTFSQITVPAANALVKIVVGGGVWIATGSSGQIWRSADGTTWGQVTSPSAGEGLWGLAYGNGKFVAIGNSFNQVIYSADGTTWTRYTSKKVEKASSGTYWFSTLIYAGGKFVSLGTTGNVFTATDGAGPWSAARNIYFTGVRATGQASSQAVAVQSGSAYIHASSPGGIIRTTDNVSFEYKELGINYNIYGITFENNILFATSDSDAFKSTDNGATWTQFTVSSGASIGPIYYGNGRYIAARLGADSIFWSTNLVTWTEVVTNSGAAVKEVFWLGGNNWVVFTTGSISYSIDNGDTWTSRGVTASLFAKKVNGVLFLSTSTGLIRTTDGSSLTGCNFSNTFLGLRDIEYYNGVYVAISVQVATNVPRPMFWWSTDGINFVQAGMPLNPNEDACYRVFVIDSILYALGNRYIYASRDGKNWTRYGNNPYGFGTNSIMAKVAGKVVVHTSDNYSSIPVSTINFRVPYIDTINGAAAYIKAT